MVRRRDFDPGLAAGANTGGSPGTYTQVHTPHAGAIRKLPYRLFRCRPAAGNDTSGRCWVRSCCSPEVAGV